MRRNVFPLVSAVALAACLLAGRTAHAIVVNPPFGDFGRIASSAASVREFTITNDTMAAIAVQLVNLAGDPCFAIEHAGPGLDQLPLWLGPGASAKFSVMFAPQGAVGVFHAEVDLDFSGDPKVAHIHLPLDGESVPAGITLSAAGTKAIAFGTVAVGSASAPVNGAVKNIGPDPVTIIASLGGAGADQFTLFDAGLPRTVPPDREALLPVAYQPLEAGQHTATLVVSAEGFPPAQIGLSGTGVAPVLEVDSAHRSIDFGMQLINRPSAPVTVGLRVPPDGVALTITGIHATNEDYQVDTTRTRLSLAPGGITSFDVVFIPTRIEPNPHLGTIEITVKGIEGPIVTVQVKGTTYQATNGILLGVGPAPSGCNAGRRPQPAAGLLLAVTGIAMLLRHRRRPPHRARRR